MINLETTGAVCYVHVGGKVIEVDVANLQIKFKIGRRKTASGSLIDWTGYFGRIPKKGDIVQGAAVWSNNWIAPAFRQNGYYGTYVEPGEKILQKLGILMPDE
jgi:hypothetical protein